MQRKVQNPNTFSSSWEETLLGVSQESILDLFQIFNIFLYDIFLTMKDTHFEIKCICDDAIMQAIENDTTRLLMV